MTINRLLLFLILIITVYFKDGRTKEYERCWMDTHRYTTSLHVYCHPVNCEGGWKHFNNSDEDKISLFDIEKIEEAV